MKKYNLVKFEVYIANETDEKGGIIAANIVAENIIKYSNAKYVRIIEKEVINNCVKEEVKAFSGEVDEFKIDNLED